MRIELRRSRSKYKKVQLLSLDRKLASYLVASASIGAAIATDANAIIISNPLTQNVGVNGAVNIDFNSDGQTDVQIDHDRVDMTLQGGPVVDYLQVDKNDINGEANPLAFDPGPDCCFAATPFADGTTTRNDANNTGYLIDVAGNGANIQYPSALTAGAEIGPTKSYDYQEGGNVYGSGKIGRMGRLIDEDQGQVDMVLGGTAPTGLVTPSNTPQFVGVEGLTRYVGVRLDLNNDSTGDTTSQFRFGWVGVRITSEADATGQIVGYGYETDQGVSILAGDPGARAGDYNNDNKVDAADYALWRKGGALQNETVTPGANTALDYTPWRLNYGGTTTSGSGIGLGTVVPEPGSALLALASGFCLICVYLGRRFRGK